jgi:hypothetical protein
MRRRPSDACTECGTDLHSGAKAVYDRLTGALRCVACATEFGVPDMPVVVDVRDYATGPDPVADQSVLLARASGTADFLARRQNGVYPGIQRARRILARWHRRGPDAWAVSAQQMERSA